MKNLLKRGYPLRLNIIYRYTALKLNFGFFKNYARAVCEAKDSTFSD